MHYVHHQQASTVRFDGHAELVDPTATLDLTFPEAPVARPPTTVHLVP